MWILKLLDAFKTGEKPLPERAAEAVSFVCPEKVLAMREKGITAEKIKGGEGGLSIYGEEELERASMLREWLSGFLFWDKSCKNPLEGGSGSGSKSGSGGKDAAGEGQGEGEGEGEGQGEGSKGKGKSPREGKEEDFDPFEECYGSGKGVKFDYESYKPFRYRYQYTPGVGGILSKNINLESKKAIDYVYGGYENPEKLSEIRKHAKGNGSFSSRMKALGVWNG